MERVMDERERILKLLEDGKITAPEAARLLEVLGERYTRFGPRHMGPEFGERIARKVELSLKNLPEMISTSISGLGFVTGDDETKEVEFKPRENLLVKSVSGDITVKGDDENTIRVKLEGGHKIHEDEKDLVIKTISGDMHLDVPTSQKIIIKAASGDINIENLSEISVRNNSGDADVKDVATITTISLGSGDISLERIQGEMTVSLGSGDLDAEDLSAVLSVSVGSGDISMELDDCKGGNIDLGSGDLDLTLPQDADVEVIVHKHKNMTLDSDFDSERTDFEPAFNMEEYKIVIGEPKTKLYVKVKRGDISISKG